MDEQRAKGLRRKGEIRGRRVKALLPWLRRQEQRNIRCLFMICEVVFLVCISTRRLVYATDSLRLTSLDGAPNSRCQVGGNAWPQLVSVFVCAKVVLRINCIPPGAQKTTEKKRDFGHLMFSKVNTQVKRMIHDFSLPASLRVSHNFVQTMPHEHLISCLHSCCSDCK